MAKQSRYSTPEGVSAESGTEYCDAIEEIATAVERLIKAGFGGTEAAKIALDVWVCCHGKGHTSHEAVQPS